MHFLIFAWKFKFPIKVGLTRTLLLDTFGIIVKLGRYTKRRGGYVENHTRFA